MLSQYDISRIAAAVVERLVNDDKFVERITRTAKKADGRLLSSTQAAKLLGISRGYVCDIASQLGGIRRGSGQRARWIFPENGLIEKFKTARHEKS